MDNIILTLKLRRDLNFYYVEIEQSVNNVILIMVKEEHPNAKKINA